ncbi:MAG: DNA alkylation repair protein [Dehalococcoidia bacterium]
MDLATAMKELEAAGSERNRAIYRRHGAGDNQFGVSMSSLKALQKQIKTDQELAEQLWETGNQDARNLATLIADPKQVTAAQLDAWLGSTDYYWLVDLFTRHLVSKSPLARDRAEAWKDSTRDNTAQAGWNLIAEIAMADRGLPDAYFEPFIDEIERDIHVRTNRTRFSMNSALIAIGLRSPSLRAKAEAAAQQIGRVEVDHGDTGCVTPDAIPYIEKSWERKLSKAKK